MSKQQKFDISRPYSTSCQQITDAALRSLSEGLTKNISLESLSPDFN